MKPLCVSSVLIVDRFPLYRDGLIQVLIKTAPSARFTTTSTLTSARAAVHPYCPFDLVFLDTGAPGGSADHFATGLHAAAPGAALVRIVDHGTAPTALDGRCVDRSWPAGVVAEAVKAALGAAAQRGAPSREAETPNAGAGAAALTPAQRRVLTGLMAGLLNKQIAHDMAISEATVKAHVTAIFRKLGVRNRTQAVITARALHLNTEEI